MKSIIFYLLFILLVCAAIIYARFELVNAVPLNVIVIKVGIALFVAISALSGLMTVFSEYYPILRIDIAADALSLTNDSKSVLRDVRANLILFDTKKVAGREQIEETDILGSMYTRPEERFRLTPGRAQSLSFAARGLKKSSLVKPIDHNRFLFILIKCSVPFLPWPLDQVREKYVLSDEDGIGWTILVGSGLKRFDPILEKTFSLLEQGDEGAIRNFFRDHS